MDYLLSRADIIGYDECTDIDVVGRMYYDCIMRDLSWSSGKYTYFVSRSSILVGDCVM